MVTIITEFATYANLILSFVAFLMSTHAILDGDRRWAIRFFAYGMAFLLMSWIGWRYYL